MTADRTVPINSVDSQSPTHQAGKSGASSVVTCSLCGIIGGTFLTLLIAVQVLFWTSGAQDRGRRLTSAVQLQRIGEALHAYRMKHGEFPPITSSGLDGRPLLSWRVHILPFLGEERLYREFHLNEPWNSTHNLAMLHRMPAVYACPPRAAMLDAYVARGVTPYAALAGAETAISCDLGPVTQERKLADRRPIVVELQDDEAINWTEPRDVIVDLTRGPDPPIRAHRQGQILLLCLDGSVRGIVPPSVPEELALVLCSPVEVEPEARLPE